MRRRELMLVLGGGMAAKGNPLRAQQTAMPIIGFLGGHTRPPASMALFHQGLGETGYIERQNLAIEYRWAVGRYERLPGLAAELVGRNVDLIVTMGGDIVALAAKGATATIPIVSQLRGDPVGAGLAASLARPGGNLTGISVLSAELIPKRTELVH